jgi:hypothetical protein
MTAVGLAAAKGAPGVTTTALLLAALWPAPAVLVEADRAGGDLRWWLCDPDGQPLRDDQGVVSLLAAHPLRAGADQQLLVHAQRITGRLPVLIGPATPAQADVLAPQWPQLAAALMDARQDVLVDVGRSDGLHEVDLRILAACGLVLIVCRGTVASLAHTRALRARLAARGCEAQVVLIGSKAQREDVRRALDADSVDLLPDDLATAQALTGGRWTRQVDRSPLLAAGRHLAATVHEQLHLTSQPTLAGGAPDLAEATPR